MVKLSFYFRESSGEVAMDKKLCVFFGESSNGDIYPLEDISSEGSPAMVEDISSQGSPAMDNDLGDIFPFEEDMFSVCSVDDGFGSEIRDKSTFYDWITNHVFNDQPLCCRWGPRLNHMNGLMRRLYLSFKANELACGTLVIADCLVFDHLVPDHCFAKFGESEVSPYVKVRKTIQVPEEVKRIRELSHGKNIVATLTDSEVQLWNFNDLQTSDPYLVLREDKDKVGSTLLALSCIADRFVLSGGTSQNVLLWDIEANSLVAADTQNNSRPITPHSIFKGHKGTVRDVQFHPSSSQVFCSVADDRRLLLWDARVSHAVAEVDTKHTDVIRSVDWNHLDPHYIITGSADQTVRLFDLRNVANSSVGSPPRTFQHREAAVLGVQWCPHNRYMFASSSNDGIINVWDHRKNEEEHFLFQNLGQVEHLFFQHVGHRGGGIVDFQWSKCDAMTIASVSYGLRQLQISLLGSWFCHPFYGEAQVNSDSESNTEIPSWQWWPQSGDIQVEEQTHKVTDSDRVTDESEQGHPRVGRKILKNFRFLNCIKSQGHHAPSAAHAPMT